jgi:hypothetical protein
LSFGPWFQREGLELMSSFQSLQTLWFLSSSIGFKKLITFNKISGGKSEIIDIPANGTI